MHQDLKLSPFRSLPFRMVRAVDMSLLALASSVAVSMLLMGCGGDDCEEQEASDWKGKQYECANGCKPTIECNKRTANAPKCATLEIHLHNTCDGKEDKDFDEYIKDLDCKSAKEKYDGNDDHKEAICCTAGDACPATPAPMAPTPTAAPTGDATPAPWRRRPQQRRLGMRRQRRLGRCTPSDP